MSGGAGLVPESNLVGQGTGAGCWVLVHESHMLTFCKQSLEKVLISCPRIRILSVKGNPLTKTAKYRDFIIERAPSLTQLDEKDVRPAEREFLLAKRKARSNNGQQQAMLL